jgi:formylglycine-generating enzyme required for sulfatase activity
MGMVYRVRERSSGRELALKLTLDASDDRRRAERFRREGELAARLDHSGIVRIHAAGTLSGQSYLAYALVEDARPLNEVLPRLPLRERVALLRDVARAVGHAHARGVIHRDLKPDNVLVDGEGRARVADFGLAAGRDLDRPPRSGAMVGTPTHMAPEQVQGRRDDQGPPTDVWALGVLLYEGITGRLPFDGQSLLALAAQISSQQFPTPRAVNPAISHELEAICLHALASDPADRYPHGDALAADLEAWLAGEATSVGSGRARLPRWPIPVALAVLVGGVAASLSAPPAPTRAASSTAATAPRPSQATVSRPKPVTPPPWPAWVEAQAPEQRPPHPLPHGLRYLDEPGEVLNAKDGSRLLWVPPGTFHMGTTAGRPDERPVREVTLSGYFVGLHEVTAKQLRAFSEATDLTHPVGGIDEHPAAFITWDLAMAYCEWAGLRLPTEAEWEYAARGRDGRRYPWGDVDPDPERCNGDLGDPYQGPSPVGAFPGDVSAAGCFDMGGNVSEWVADYHADRYPEGPELDPQGPRRGTRRVRRGGSWKSEFQASLSASNRGSHEPTHASGVLGFRVAR